MLASELKQPQNLRRVGVDINLNNCIIQKGALGYLIGRTTIEGPITTWFISLCERYEFNVTDISNNHFDKV